MTKPHTESIKVSKEISGKSYKENLDQIAAALVVCAQCIREINSSKLKRRAILLLMHDMTKLPKSDIESVLNAAARIDVEYLK